MLIAMSFAMTTSIYWMLAIVLDETLDGKFRTLTIGYFGTTLMALGVCGMLPSGFVLNVTRMYKWHIVVVMALALVSLAVFTYLVQNDTTESSMFGISAVVGFIMPASQPALLELAAVSCPMIDEYVGGTLLFFWTQMFAIVFSVVMIVVVKDLNILYYVFLGIYGGVLAWFLISFSSEEEDPGYSELAATEDIAHHSRSSSGEGA